MANDKTPSTPSPKRKPSRHAFRSKARTGVKAGRLFDSQNG